MSSPTRPLISAVAMFFNMLFFNMFQPWWFLFSQLPKTKCGTTVSRCRGAKKKGLHRTYTRTCYHTVCGQVGPVSLTYEIPMYNVSNLQACGAAQNQQIDLCTCSHVSPMIAIKIRKHSAAQRYLLTVSRELKGTQETLMTCFDLFHVIHWFDCRDFFIFLQIFACLHVGCTNHLASGSIFAHCGETQVLQPMSLGQDRLDCLSTDSETF